MPLEFGTVVPLLQVFDMPTSLAFYRDVLQFAIVHSAPGVSEVPGDMYAWVWLRHGSADVMLNAAYDPDAVRPASPDPARIAAHEDTVLFIACPNVDGVYTHLLTHGIQATPPRVAPHDMLQLYVTDPDGYNLCFQWPDE